MIQNPTLVSYDQDSYNVKKPWQRMIISFAGPFSNFLLAFLIYLSISVTGVPKLLPTIGDLNQSQPAYQAGMQKGDQIVSINGQKISYWEDIGNAITKNSSSIEVLLLRNNEQVELSITPQLYDTQNVFKENIQRKLIGIKPDVNQTTSVQYGLEEGLNYAYMQTQHASMMIVKSLQKMISGMIPLEQLGGVVSIVDVTAKASSVGIISLLFFTALISVNLGILNLLPIPALDGGHIMFNLYEMIMKKVPNEEVMYKLTLFGWSFLLSIMLLGLYNDINRLLG